MLFIGGFIRNSSHLLGNHQRHGNMQTMRTTLRMRRKWLLKCGLGWIMEQFRSPPDMDRLSNLPHKQADVSVQNTPTPRINTETARPGRPARPSLPGEPTCWTANLRILTSAAMIVASEGEADCRQERRLLLTEFDLVRWHIIKDGCLYFQAFSFLLRCNQ